jgi:glycosyltransferase involved in cell wall biosynthesis
MRSILWVNGWPDVGGAERAQLNVFRHLAKTNRITAVLAEEARPRLVTEIEAAGIAVHRAPLTQLRQTVAPRALARFAYRFSRTTVALARLMRRLSPDIVHTAYLYDVLFCGLAAGTARVPLFWLIENPERFDRVNTAFLNASRLSGYAGTSTSILAAARAHGVRARTTGLVPNSYDELSFYPSTAPPPRRETIHIGFAGIFHDRKGVLELCQAFGVLKHMLQDEARHDVRPKLMLAGDGDAHYKREMYETLRSFSADGDVSLLSSLTTPGQMRNFYQALDIYVMLSKREGLSVAMLEALACGVPSAILSPWGDDVIEDGVHGIRLPSSDPVTVAGVLRTLVLNAGLRSSLGCAAARRLRSEFASDAVAPKLARFYEQVIDRSA